MTNGPKRIRTLLVDDLSSTRRALSDALGSEADVEVIGTAATVRSALARIGELAPDVVVTKLDLPDHGLTLLKSLNQLACTVPLVVFDVDLERGSLRNLDARLAGAASCVTRPVDRESLADVVRNVLAPAIRTALRPRARTSGETENSAGRTRMMTSASTAKPDSESVAVQDSASLRVRAPRLVAALIVAVAASTGGPDALAEVLVSLPRDFSTPVLIVQHMPSGFTNTLAERLSTLTGRRIAEGRDAALLDEAEIWIAPGGRHLLIERRGLKTCLKLTDAEPEISCRPSANVLFRSVAASFGSRTLGVVLTGMGQDGLEGSRTIRDCGGQLIVQDQATSVAWAMPRAVHEARLADMTLPLNAIAGEIYRRCRRTEA